MLTRGHANGFVAEDLVGSVRLNLKRTKYHPGLYFEGGIFVFQGLYSAGVLDVESMCLCKSRETMDCERMSRAVAGRIDENDRIILLSDVHLDISQVMRALFHLLSGFATCPPNVFILCGPFLSTHTVYGYTEAASTPFRHLVSIASQGQVVLKPQH